MNYKPTILVSQDKTVFQKVYLAKQFEKYFTIEILDTNKSYNLQDTVVVSDALDHEQGINLDELRIADTGVRHVLDQCWDSWSNHLSRLSHIANFVWRPRYFLRVNESFWYKHLGYNKLDFTSNTDCDFLLLMNGLRSHRTDLHKSLQKHLAHNIHSYVEYGVDLQNAKDSPYEDTDRWQRFVDPEWYTRSRFSIVTESDVYLTHYGDRIVDFPNCSEKSFKPCAFKHPSIILGQQGVQQELINQGFATFNHVNYDSVEDYTQRFGLVMEYIELAISNPDLFRDSESQEKIEHNYHWFYNDHAIEKIFKESMVDPLLEFIES